MNSRFSTEWMNNSNSSSQDMSLSQSMSVPRDTHIHNRARQIVKDNDEAEIFSALKRVVLLLLKQHGPVETNFHDSVTDPHSQVFAVGGWVRDKLMQLESDDIDFVVPHKTLEFFTSHLEEFLRNSIEDQQQRIMEWEPSVMRTIPDSVTKMPLNLKRINLIINRGEPDEKSFKLDFRELGPNESLLDDSKRRDFRMNSVYYDVWTNQTIDVVNVD